MNNASDRDLLLVSIFTFLTVLSWIFFELVKTVKTTTITAPVQQIITPLNPKLDTGILTILERRQLYGEQSEIKQETEYIEPEEEVNSESTQSENQQLEQTEEEELKELIQESQ